MVKSPAYTPERAAKQLALMRNVIAGATHLGCHLSMSIAACSTFTSRCRLNTWPEIKDAFNAEVHWDLPGEVRFVARRKISLPCESTTPSPQS